MECHQTDYLHVFHSFFFCLLLWLYEFHFLFSSSLSLSSTSSILLNPFPITFSLFSSALWLLFGSLIFSISWHSHCVYSFPNSVSIFVTTILNSLSGKITYFHFTKVSSEVFSCSFGTYSCFFVLHDALCCFYVLERIATSPRLDEAASRRRWTLSFNPRLVLGCLSNLCDCPTVFFIFDGSQ